LMHGLILASARSLAGRKQHLHTSYTKHTHTEQGESLRCSTNELSFEACPLLQTEILVELTQARSHVDTGTACRARDLQRNRLLLMTLPHVEELHIITGQWKPTANTPAAEAAVGV
jgi:hypothetical protein